MSIPTKIFGYSIEKLAQARRSDVSSEDWRPTADYFITFPLQPEIIGGIKSLNLAQHYETEFNRVAG